jgi:hypothetical protein
MTRLGTYAALAGLLVTVALVAAPVEALAPAPVGTTTTVAADCFVGRGAVSLRQTRQDAGSTLVDAAGTDVRNGRWRGAFSLGSASSNPPDATDVRATASGREFQKSFEVDGTARSSSLTMVSGRRHVCGVYLGEQAKSMFFGSPQLTFIARYPEPGEMTARVVMAGCRNGSRWRYSAEIDYSDYGVGWGSSGLVCRDGQVRVPKSPVSSDGGDERPSAIKVVFRSSTGQKREISYRTEGPA